MSIDSGINRSPDWDRNNEYDPTKNQAADIATKEKRVAAKEADNLIKADSQQKASESQEIKKQAEIYAQTAKSPTLEAPKTDKSGSKALEEQPLTMDAFTKLKPTADETFARNVMANILKSFPKEEQTKAMMAFQNPEFVDENSDIAKAVKALMQNVGAGMEGLTDQAGAGKNTKNILALLTGGNFEKQLKEMNLSPKEMKQLIHAFSHPEDLGKLSPKLQAAFKEAVAGSMGTMAEAFGIKEDVDLTGPNMKSYMSDKKMTEDYDNNFEAALEQFAQENDLSTKDQATLKAMHYHPDADFPEAEKMKEVFKNIESKVMGEVINEYGLPDGTKPVADKKTFDAMATGRFLRELEAALKNVEPPLTSGEIDQMLKAAMGKDVKLPSRLQAIFNQYHQSTLEGMQEEMGMSTWVPLIGKPHPLAKDPGTMKMLKGSVEMLESGIESAKQLHAQNPFTGPNRIDYGKFLMVVSAMMNLLKETIFTMTANDAEISTILSKGRYDTKMNQLLKQRIQIDNQREQIEKQESMSWMGPVMTAIVVIVCVLILGPTAGLLVGAIFAALMQTDALTKLFDAITKLVGMICEAMGLPESVTKIITAVVKILVIIILTILALPAGPMIMMMMFFMALSSSKAIDDIAMACGADKETAGYISMGVQIALMVVAMVVMIKNPAIITELAAAAVPELVMNVATMASQMVARMSAQVTAYMTEVLGQAAAMASEMVGQTATEVISTIVTGLQSVLTSEKGMMDALAVGVGVAEASIQLASSVQGVVTHLKLHDLAMIEAELEQDVQVLEGVFKVMGTVQDNFQNAVVEGTSWAADVNKLQNEKWNKLSRVMTGLYSA